MSVLEIVILSTLMLTLVVSGLLGAPIKRGVTRVASSASNAHAVRMASSPSNAHAEALDFYYKLASCKEPSLTYKISSSLSVLADGLRLYGPDSLFSSYNGGKDAVVTMHLLRAAVAKYSEDKKERHRPHFVYFGMEGEFQEVEQFLREDEQRYSLDLSRHDMGIAQGLSAHMDSVQAHTGSKHFAFVLGTRKGDPNCGDQEKFSPSSAWMPDFMRVNPILDWSYGDVWHFIRHYELPYCHLYDEGYTSLGKVSDTKPNPALKRSDGSGGFWPAYMLADWSLERAGRGETIDVATTANDDAGRSTATSLKAPCLGNAETAALVIIGNEILSGLVSDANVLTAAQALAKAGVDLKHVTMCADDRGSIAAEVRKLKNDFDCVFTSGGVGPTHDDVTIKAVADALNQKIVLNDIMAEHVREVMGDNFDQKSASLAFLPEGTKLNYPRPDPESKFTPWPILQVDNVFILPGVPDIFRKKIETITTEGMLAISSKPLTLRVIHLDLLEVDVMSAIASIEDKAAQEGVDVGVYEMKGGDAVSSRVTLRGRESAAVDDLQEKLISNIGLQHVLSVENNE